LLAGVAICQILVSNLCNRNTLKCLKSISFLVWQCPLAGWMLCSLTFASTRASTLRFSWKSLRRCCTGRTGCGILSQWEIRMCDNLPTSMRLSMIWKKLPRFFIRMSLARRTTLTRSLYILCIGSTYYPGLLTGRHCKLC